MHQPLLGMERQRSSPPASPHHTTQPVATTATASSSSTTTTAGGSTGGSGSGSGSGTSSCASSSSSPAALLKTTFSFDEAMRIPALRSVHHYVSTVWKGELHHAVSLDTLPLKFGSPLPNLDTTHIQVTIPRHIKLMRWLSVIAGDAFGHATTKPLIVGIDADCIDYVYESIDLESYLLDPDSSLQGYACDSTTLCGFHAKSLDARHGRPPDARLQLSRECPTRKAIDLHVHFLWRWLLPSGGVRALVCTTALDVTDTYFTRADAKREAFERDVCDHRYGNYIRESQLLLEARLYDRLHCSLEFLADEIDIRRGKPVSNKAVDLAYLFEPCVQSLKYDRTTLPRQKLWFKTSTGSIVPYKVIQVKILLDVCSNAVKHGDGFITIVHSPTIIRVMNRVAIKRSSSKRSSSLTGLRALKAECEALGLAINFRNQDTVFEAVISVVTEEEASESEDTRSVVAPGAAASASFDRRTPPAAPTNRTPPPWRAKDLAWIIIDDQPTICTLWSKHMLNHHGVQLKTLSSPAEVANAAAVLWETVSDARLVVCIMDEHLFELTPSFEIRPCTGTQLRDRFDQKPKLRDAIRQAKIHFVGASSTEIFDPRLHSVIGKYGTTSKMIKTILGDIAVRESYSLH